MFLETLRAENGHIDHLSYHQARVNRSLEEIGFLPLYDLASLITPPSEGIYRCRFLYSAEGYEVTFHPYTPRAISSLKILYADTLDYHLKYSDRAALDDLFSQRGECSDVLIVKNGYLTDTTIANIALFIDGRWLTPDIPLLNGTTRARLIDEGFLTPKPLRIKDLAKATKIALMNAMMGFIEVESGIIT
jgi:4-amino-4-deoxychorismate lyase